VNPDEFIEVVAEMPIEDLRANFSDLFSLALTIEMDELTQEQQQEAA
jgi:hypothetical protein